MQGSRNTYTLCIIQSKINWSNVRLFFQKKAHIRKSVKTLMYVHIFTLEQTVVYYSTTYISYIPFTDRSPFYIRIFKPKPHKHIKFIYNTKCTNCNGYKLRLWNWHNIGLDIRKDNTLYYIILGISECFQQHPTLVWRYIRGNVWVLRRR